MPGDSVARARFQVALDLSETGIVLQRQRLRRLHPEAPAAEIEHRVNQWLQERPGAEQGDGPQRPPDADAR